MNTIILIIALQILVITLTGCGEFQTKMDMMQNEQLTCSAEEESLCAGWKI
jgi:uncharacterized membrane protein affecting hemolysin expression